MSLRDIGRAIQAAWLAVVDYPIPWEQVVIWLLVPVWLVVMYWILRSWVPVLAALTWRHRLNLGIAWRMFLDRRRDDKRIP